MATPRAESEDQLKLRFQVELEFVQCLANPNYLNFLAQRDYFKDPALINYLKYLQYWKEPEYARYLKYPMCLYFLDLLQYPEFRKELANAKCAKFIEDQQLLHWQHYIRKRSKLIPPSANTASIAQAISAASGAGGGGTTTGSSSGVGGGGSGATGGGPQLQNNLSDSTTGSTTAAASTTQAPGSVGGSTTTTPTSSAVASTANTNSMQTLQPQNSTASIKSERS